MFSVLSSRYITATILSVMLLASAADAVVLCTDGDPAGLPPEQVVGRWSTNASCVVISPNYVITTQHQGGGINSIVTIDGVAYKVAQEFAHSTADLRVDRLTTMSGQPANLPYYVSMYKSNREKGMDVLFGGYGKGRGSALTTNGQTYGYAWEGSDNLTERWGMNTIDNTINSFGTYELVADFDRIGEGDGVNFNDSAVALYDSGCGWFTFDTTANRWKVAGLTTGAEHASVQQSWFASNTDPTTSDPDLLYAIRVSSYAIWVESVMDPYFRWYPGDASGNGVVDVVDLSTLGTYYGTTSGATWAQGDFNADGKVNVVDLSLLGTSWKYGVQGVWNYGTAPNGAPLPEPASLAILSLGAIWLARFRSTRK